MSGFKKEGKRKGREGKSEKMNETQTCMSDRNYKIK